MYQIFLIQISFQSSDSAVLDFCIFFRSKLFKFELFSQGVYNFPNLRNETLVIADYKYAKIFSFAMFDMKL